MTLNEREAHCLARLLQGAWYATPEKGMAGSLTACHYCKIQCYNGNNEFVVLEDIKKRLMEETGVDLSPASGQFLMDSDFPYHKFLKNANEGIRNYFRERFNHI